MSQRQIFKIAILSHDEPLFERLYDVFGVDFEKAMTQTSGAAFSYSHFDVDDQRLTAQFWMLEGSPQWSSIRNLYLKGVSGIVLLYDPSIKNGTAINKRLLREFVTANRFPVPIIILDVSDSKSINKSQQFGNDIARWTGYHVPAISKSDDNLQSVLNEFMGDVKDWRARNVIFQTLKLYFSLDSINHGERSISKIIAQLRQIYTSRYYELLDDEKLPLIIQQAIYMEGFDYDSEKKAVIYMKEIKKHPWVELEAKIHPDDYDKPKVEKIE